MPWQLMLVLLLPIAAAFQATAPTQTSQSRIQSRQTMSLHAWNSKPVANIGAEVTTKATEAVPSTDLETAQLSFSALAENLDSLLQSNVEKMQTLLNQVNEAFVTLLSTLANGNGEATGPLINLNLEPLFAQMKEIASAIGVSNEDVAKIISLINGVTGALNTPETIAATAVVSYVVINSILTWGDSPPPGRPYPKGKYDPVGARIFFDRRPLQVLARSLTIASKSFAFALSVAGDYLQGDETWNKNQEQRGFELAQLLTELGPTFIKSELVMEYPQVWKSYEFHRFA